ncbi:MAG: DUF1343 domain-containing protein [Chloroflexi bacterium]|nr:DUF1343 domain-containing protein [Chloroflexota bacterium]
MIKTGLQVLLEERLNLLAGRRVGLVSHTAAVLPDVTGIASALVDAGVTLAAIFGLGPGFTNSMAASREASDAVDRRFGVPVYSLYGEVQEPSPAMLSGVNTLVVDFQDVGTRYFSSLSTLFFVLRAAGSAEIPVILLDRPNPINGVSIEGPLGVSGFELPEGVLPIPIRHGMTMAELALYLNNKFKLNASLTIVPMQGWSRGMWFDDTGLQWVSPLSDLPHFSTAVVYPGMCLLEGTNLSHGKGTPLPYELLGAPWIDSYALADHLNKERLPGVRFRPTSFIPVTGNFAGQVCEGVQAHVVDRIVYQPVHVGLHVIEAVRMLALNDFEFIKPSATGSPQQMDLLSGVAQIKEHLIAGKQVSDLLREWKALREQFAEAREPYLLYR